MHVVVSDEAPGYEAPGHHRMAMCRLQGRARDAILGPRAVRPWAAQVRRVVESVLEGRTSRATLRPLDSCRIGPGESRALHNDSQQPCKVLLVMPLAKPVV